MLVTLLCSAPGAPARHLQCVCACAAQQWDESTCQSYTHARTRLYFFSSRLGHFQMLCLRQWRLSVVAHTPSRVAASRRPRLKHDCSARNTKHDVMFDGRRAPASSLHAGLLLRPGPWCIGAHCCMSKSGVLPT